MKDDNVIIDCSDLIALWDHLQILLLILRELRNFYSPWKSSENLGFRMIWGGIEVN